MKLLILGGTHFLGRAIAARALELDWELTLFNRGKSNPDLFPEAEHLRGDRDGDLGALEQGRWDLCVDTCGYVPRIVSASAELLADRVDRYIFISSISAYGPPMDSGVTEESPVQTIEDESVEEITGESYGALKVLCEQAAEAALPGRSISLRAGLIVGPYDPTDRMTYWPVKLARQERVLVPPSGSPAQVIDVRDLAAWCLQLGQDQASGVFNATGPDSPMTFGEMLAACQAKATPVEASEAWLLEQEVEPWADLPLWLPADKQSMHEVDIGKALEHGLTFRPLGETMRDTLAWLVEERGIDDALKTGLSVEREGELLGKLG